MLDPDAAATFAAQHGIADPARRPGRSPGRPRRGRRGGPGPNGKLSRVEQVKRFAIVPVSWDPGSDKVTPTMKVKRHAVTASYADVIESLYAGAGQPAQAARTGGPQAG